MADTCNVQVDRTAARPEAEMKPGKQLAARPAQSTSVAASALVAQIEAATRAGDAGSIRRALAQCAVDVIAGEIDLRGAQAVNRAGRKANKAMRDAHRRIELVAKVATAAEKARRIDMATSITLPAGQFKRIEGEEERD
jgi:hypothetical protein